MEMNRNLNPCFLLFSPCTDGFAGRLIEMLDASFPGFGLEVFLRQEDMRKRLCDPKQNIISAILVAPSPSDLRSAEVLQPMLEDIPVVIVLGEGDAEGIAAAHRFHPRFLTYLDEDGESIVKVLRQLAWKKEAYRYGFQFEVPAAKTDRWSSESFQRKG
jgi:hypothetical protein